MLQTLCQAALILAMINLVIIVHELGHYAAARIFNIRVHTIAIGFGKIIWKNDKWQFSIFPLGGYVSMLDSRDKNTSQASYPYCLDKQKAWKKIIVYLAGPAANIICAIAVYWSILIIGINYVIPEVATVTPNSIAAEAMMPNNSLITNINGKGIDSWKDVNIALTSLLGSTNNIIITTHNKKSYILNTKAWKIDSLNFDPITSLGMNPYEPDTEAIIVAVKPNGPAAIAGLKPRDKIIAINSTKILSYNGLKAALKPLINSKINVKVLREGKFLTIPVKTGSAISSSWRMTGYLGIKAPKAIWDKGKIKHAKYNTYDALGKAIQNSYQILSFNITIFSKIITNIIPITSVSGPLGFIKSSLQALNSSFTIFFETFAIFNILLAFINLLPIPGLDGGNILFISYEKLTKKEINILHQGLITKFSFILLVIIAIHATINDVLRIIS